MKKLISVLLAIVMIFSMSTVCAFAADETESDGIIDIEHGDTGNDDEIEDKNELELYMIAEQIKTTTDEKAILKAYEKYNDVGIVLQSIAKNHFAPCVILSELCSIKGVKNAASIRKISKETLKTKQSTK